VESAVVCPPAEAYSPCKCVETAFVREIYKPGTIYLQCYERNLSDLRLSDILDAFLTTPGVSPVGKLGLSFNQLTKVPKQIKLLPQVVAVDLKGNNISSIESGAFNFTTLQFLEMQKSQVVNIAPGAFQGNGKVSSIDLRNNNFTRFEANVFQSLLEKGHAQASNTPHLFMIIKNNPINCDCHLAWLIRDNRHLLKAVHFGQCSNGTTFEDLNANGFAHCSADCPAGSVFNPIKKQCDKS